VIQSKSFCSYAVIMPVRLLSTIEIWQWLHAGLKGEDASSS
jgi:hypothetical protein